MIRRQVTILSTLIWLLATAAHGQDFSPCVRLITDGLRNFNLAVSDSANLDAVWDHYCSTSSSTSSQSFGLGLDAMVNLFPASLTGNYSDSKTAMSNFCHNYQSNRQSSNRSFNYSSTVTSRGYDSFDACVALMQSGVAINSNQPTNDALDVRIQPSTTSTLNLQGVVASRNVTCEGAIDGKARVVDKNYIRKITEPTSFHCSRTSSTIIDPKTGEAVQYYAEASGQVLSSIRNFDVVMPEVSVFPLRQAKDIAARLSSLENHLAVPVAHCEMTAPKVNVPYDGDHVPVDYDSCAIDTHRAVGHSAGAWSFSAPWPGIYAIDASIVNSEGSFAAVMLATPAGKIMLGNRHAPHPSWEPQIGGYTLIRLKAGETVSVEVVTRNTAGNSYFLGGPGTRVDVSYVRD